MHLVGFAIEIYYDARSYKCQKFLYNPFSFPFMKIKVTISVPHKAVL